MNYLLTGANGYIGKYLCDELKRKNIIFKNPSRYELNLSDYREVCGYIRANNVNNIIHLAAKIDTDNCSDLFESNIHALYSVLRAITKEQIQHFTFVSTNNVYGTGYNRPILESDRCIPCFSNSYAISKYVGELMVEDQLQKSTVSYAIARVADVYGPNQRIGELIKKIVKNMKINVSQEIYGSGIRQRDYIYVEDAARALVYISSHHLEGIYNVSTGVGTSVREMIECAESIVKCGIEQVEIAEGREDKTCVILDNSKLSREGYTYTISITDGLKKILSET